MGTQTVIAPLPLLSTSASLPTPSCRMSTVTTSASSAGLPPTTAPGTGAAAAAPGAMPAAVTSAADAGGPGHR